MPCSEPSVGAGCAGRRGGGAAAAVAHGQAAARTCRQTEKSQRARSTARRRVAPLPWRALPRVRSPAIASIASRWLIRRITRTLHSAREGVDMDMRHCKDRKCKVWCQFHHIIEDAKCASATLTTRAAQMASTCLLYSLHGSQHQHHAELEHDDDFDHSAKHTFGSFGCEASSFVRAAQVFCCKGVGAG